MDSDPVQVVVTVSSPEGMTRLNRVIHDRVFDLEDVSTEDDTLVIPFADELFEASYVVKKGFFRTTHAIPRVRAFLEVGNVDSFQIIDRAEVGTYEFSSANVIRVDRVVIEAVPDLRIEIDVHGLSMRVRRTGERLPERKSRSLFGGLMEITDSKG